MCYSGASGNRELVMRTTVNLDDELLAEAERVSGIKERVTLVNEGIKALIERESARRLARLGGIGFIPGCDRHLKTDQAF